MQYTLWGERDRAVSVIDRKRQKSKMADITILKVVGCLANHRL